MKIERIYLSLCLCLLCASCTNDPSLKDGDENPHTSQGKLVPIEIVLDPTIGYNQQEPPATRIGMNGQTESVPLIAEWVSMKPFSAIGAAYNGPAMASMELRQDIATPTTDAPINTRAAMVKDVRFRLIVFRKEEDTYKFYSAADYYISDTGPAMLQSKGIMNVPIGSTIRVVGYTLNAAGYLGDLPTTYDYGESSISVSNDNDFATFDSGEKEVKSSSFDLKVKFVQRLCKLTIKIKTTGFFQTNDYSGIDATVNAGGSDMKWTVAGGVSDNGVTGTATEAHFTMKYTTLKGAIIRCLPSSASQFITVHFNTATIGASKLENFDVSSTSKVKMESGNSYTMIVQFKKTLGTQLRAKDMDLCTREDDKDALSRLIWADGNLKGTEYNKYEWDLSYGTGYYFNYMSRYTFEGDLSTNKTDPCTWLNSDIYKGGWRTPKEEELYMMVRCASSPEFADRWFMAKYKGVFLPAAGFRSVRDGCGIKGTQWGMTGFYGCKHMYDYAGNVRMLLYFDHVGNIEVQSKWLSFAATIRCVKDAKPLE